MNLWTHSHINSVSILCDTWIIIKIVTFPGENLDGKLTIDRFLDFQEELQRAILTLEFQRKDPNDEGLITEKQFAELILVKTQ